MRKTHVNLLLFIIIFGIGCFFFNGEEETFGRSIGLENFSRRQNEEFISLQEVISIPPIASWYMETDFSSSIFSSNASIFNYSRIAISQQKDIKEPASEVKKDFESHLTHSGNSDGLIVQQFSLGINSISKSEKIKSWKSQQSIMTTSLFSRPPDNSGPNVIQGVPTFPHQVPLDSGVYLVLLPLCIIMALYKIFKNHQRLSNEKI